MTSLHVGTADLFTGEETMAQGYKVTGWGRDLNPGLWRREGAHGIKARTPRGAWVAQ